jgi:hypothetical protein
LRVLGDGLDDMAVEAGRPTAKRTGFRSDFGALQRRLAHGLDRILRVIKPSELAIKYPFVVLASSAVTVASASALVRSAVCGF